jgi:7-carboxy-7-deazaguanine synthase
MHVKPSESNSNELPVVEVFRTIQGEGYHTGKAAVFIRLAGCDICCNWCDSRNSWNADDWPKLPVTVIAERVLDFQIRDVIISGGEPLQHDLSLLTNFLHRNNRKVFLETSGASPITGNWDWICLSPKRNAPPLNTIYPLANEMKVVVSSEADFDWADDQSKHLNSNCLLYLQPEWSAQKQIIPLITDYILENPVWMLSLQSHKYIGIP